MPLLQAPQPTGKLRQRFLDHGSLGRLRLPAVPIALRLLVLRTLHRCAGSAKVRQHCLLMQQMHTLMHQHGIIIDCIIPAMLITFLPDSIHIKRNTLARSKLAMQQAFEL